MQDTQDTQPETAPPARKRRWPFIAAGVLSVLGVVGFLTLRSLSEQPLVMPDWLTELAEARVNKALGGPSVRIGGIELTVGARGLPRLVMRNVGVFDARGTPIAQLNRMGARLDRAGMFSGEFKPRQLSLSGSEITLRRRADGAIDLSLGGGLEASGDAANILTGIDEAFRAQPLDSVRRIAADDITIVLEDARTGRVWQVTGGTLELAQDAGRIDLSVSAEVFNGTEDLASAEFRVGLDRETGAAALSMDFENAAAADIAAQSPALAFLTVLDAPISGTLETSLDALGTFTTLAGSLVIGEGALTPEAGTPPMAFGGAALSFDYSPADHRIALSELMLETEALAVSGSGHAYLREFRAGWPAALVGQFRADSLTLAPKGVFHDPVSFTSAAADLRVRLDPFTAEIGQLTLINGDRRFLGKGAVHARVDGWETSLDVSLNEIDPARLLELWPVKFARGTRNWLTENLQAGRFYDLQAALRGAPDGSPPRLSLSYKFQNATVRYIKSLPPIRNAAGYASILNETYAMVLEEGAVSAPNGDVIDVAGTLMQIPDIGAAPARAFFALHTDGTIPGTLSLLDLPPFSLMEKAGRSPTVAAGRARLDAALSFDLLKVIKLDDVDFSVAGTLEDVSSDTLVTNRVFAAEKLRLEADRTGLGISGAGTLDGVGLTANWTQSFGAGQDGISQVVGDLELSPRALEGFNITLPPGTVSGQGKGAFTLDLRRGSDPVLALQSDLSGVELRIAALGWQLPPDGTGQLEIDATLGPSPDISRLSLEAPGLSAAGRISLTDAGQLDEARFDRVSSGNWFNAPVLLRGRGAAPPQVVVGGGSADLRRVPEIDSGDGSSGGEGMPVEVALDRLVISDGIMLTDFRGQFRDRGGLEGPFTGRINGATEIRGDIVAQDGRSAFRLRSNDGGRAMSDAGLMSNLRGGDLEVMLQPTGAEGTYEGSLTANGVRLLNAPALTELLSVISVVGLIEQMNGGGIGLETIRARFRLSPNLLTLYQASAVGPSLGLSLDGRYDLNAKVMDMQGVLSPIYFVNAIGGIVSTRRGEGLIGINFTMNGPADAPRVSVNPLSILTPGMFRDIFRRPPPARVTQ